MRDYLLGLLCLALFSHPLLAQESVQIDAILKNPFIRADFKKERQLKILSKPFVTHGYMLFKADQGMIWKTTRPIIDTLLIKPDEVRQLDRQPESPAMNNPLMASASDMFLTLMSRDKDRILAVFDYVEETGLTLPTFKLIPRDEQLRTLVSSIHLSGRDRIEIIEILEKGGDSTRIYLSNEIFDEAGLSTQERMLFERI